MRGLNLLSILVVFLFSLCSNKLDQKEKIVQSENSYVDSTSNLIRTRVSDTGIPYIDSIVNKANNLYSLKKNLEVYVKVSGRSDLVQVHDMNNWPQSIVVTYNLIADSLKRPVLFKEIPYVESGDQYIVNNYYFDDNRKTVAIKTRNSFFNELCSEDALKELTTKYYNADFGVIFSDYSLLDYNGNKLDTTQCHSQYEFVVNEYKDYSATPLGMMK